MCYSLDLRKKVISFIENGNSITKAVRIFGINRTTVYRWLDKPNLEPIRVVRRKRKIIVISNKFATFAFTCKPCPGRGYSDDQCLKVLHFPVKRL